MAVSDDSERYVNIPSFIFRDRSLAALEAVVVYLKDSQGLTYSQIAKLLNRDDRTIWTTYQRAKKKIGKEASGKAAGEASGAKADNTKADNKETKNTGKERRAGGGGA